MAKYAILIFVFKTFSSINVRCVVKHIYILFALKKSTFERCVDTIYNMLFLNIHILYFMYILYIFIFIVFHSKQYTLYVTRGQCRVYECCVEKPRPGRLIHTAKRPMRPPLSRGGVRVAMVIAERIGYANNEINNISSSIKK